MKRISQTVVSATACLLLGSAAMAADSIHWQQWQLEAFERAKQQHRIILVSVGMEGCAACARMESLTYTDPAVIERINRDFVAIHVDAEARPDIGDRYSDWAWPATIFLAPDATQVLALRGNRLPRNFLPILNDLVSRQEAGELQVDPRSPYAASPQPAETDLTRMRDRLRAQLDRSLNRNYGGWSRNGIGGEQSGSRLRHLYMRAHMYDDNELRQLALKSSAGFLESIDPVWGGVYIGSFPAGLEVPARFAGIRAIPEKRILVQSNAITAFAIAYKQTGDSKYLDGLSEVDRFLKEWMMAPDGTFYSNQKAESPDLPENMSAGEYWSLNSDAERRQYGLPPIDHAIYTDRNGEMIAALVLAYESTGNRDYLTTAERAANAILGQRRHDDGWVLQTVENNKVSDDERMRPLFSEERPFLSAQAWFGSGLLALYRVTGESNWLEAASAIGAATMDTLHDDRVGGFYATIPDATASIIAPRKPLEANGTAASFFYDLSLYTKDERYVSVAGKVIPAVGQPEIIRREGRITGEFAIALEKLTATYVEFSVVGDTDHPNAQALFDAGLAVFEPRKVLHFEAPGRYPDKGLPAMYICNPDMCSIPITDPQEVAKQAAAFRGPAAT